MKYVCCEIREIKDNQLFPTIRLTKYINLIDAINYYIEYMDFLNQFSDGEAMKRDCLIVKIDPEPCRFSNNRPVYNIIEVFSHEYISKYLTLI
jgi:hypothetical protein